MSFEIIDFHTHPFLRPENNICSHQCVCNLQSGDILEEMRALGVSKFCGSVIAKAHEEDKNVWDRLKRANDDALALREIFGEAYIPGFHVHPAFVEQSPAKEAFPITLRLIILPASDTSLSSKAS